MDVHGLDSWRAHPPAVPGERSPPCEGHLGKGKFATAQAGEVQGITMIFTGAPAHFGIAGNIQHLAEIGSIQGKAQQNFQYLLLPSLAMLTHQVNKAYFSDLKCERHVSRPQKKVSKGKILKKKMPTCDYIQALIPEVDGYQNDSRNLESSKYGFKYFC